MNEHASKLLRIIAACVVLACGLLFPQWKLYLFLSAYVIAGYDVLLEALEGIRKREIFDECFLMAIATIGALVLGEYLEACAVMILYQTGELFQDYASDRSRKSITALMDIRPDYANVEHEGRVERAEPKDVPAGSVILVKPGEKIPIDGVIVEGHSAVDARALTGESVPVDKAEGDEVLSGCVNMTGVLRVRTTRDFQDSAVSKILDLVENAESRKAKAENFITRFAKVYTPAVCASALLLVIVPSLFSPKDFTLWLYRALTFLVISCPCALVIGIPLTFFAALGGAGRAGILVKGSNFLEGLAKTSCVVFDKTGTLTRGVFEVVAVHPDIRSEEELLHLAAHVERYSVHPAADALRRAYPNESDSCVVEEAEELAGLGVRARVNGETVCVGNSKLMEKAGAEWHPCSRSSGTVIHVAIDGVYAGHVVISDVVKDSSREAVNALRAEGITRIAMLTGDTKASAEAAGSAVGIDEVYAELLPADKVAHVEAMGNDVVFVGDGINDAPVLARAGVGVAMGALGSDAAIEAADVVLMNDDPLKVAEAVRISRKCMRIVRENIAFTVGVKVLCMVLGALGMAGMWAAVFADVGVMVLAVMNALRAMLQS
ncbi:MAG: cadmium-translocating P-type ATPase [Synergistaceae bacterium]|nr:cadmium-translocating P-type ATPase [Synergistaceae bacterium]